MKHKRSTTETASNKMGIKPGSPKFQLTTFGKPALYFAGTEVALQNRKSLALLAYLSTRESQSESRERLAGLLWGDSSEEKARGSLRQTLSRFRETAAVDLIDSNRLDIGLSSGALVTDHRDILSALEAGHLDERLLVTSRICSSFLEGYEDIDSGFRNWVMVYRQGLEDKFMRLLEVQMSNAGDAVAQRNVATAILNIEPTHEPAARAAMSCFVEAGEPSGALRIYNTLWDTLGNEFDTEPTAETQQLVAKIKLGEKLPVIRKAPVQGFGRQEVLAPDSREKIGHFLQVADFNTDDVHADRKGVVRIFRTELLATLTRFRDWRVQEASQVSPQLSGPEPGISHVIEASSYDEGSNLRFVLTLRESPGGKFVWSERFSLGADAWFDTMRNVIRRIAVALEVNISSERLDRVAGKPELSFELFDRWLRGQLSIFRWKPEDEAMAEQLFRSIIKEAPNYAPAYAGMAGILNVRHLIFPGLYRSGDTQREALLFASRAVEIDPLDSRTQLHLAWSHAMSEEYHKASMTFQLAFELNSDDPWTLVSAAEGLALCGSVGESLELVRMAQDTGLLFSELQWSYQAVIWFVAGKYENCIKAASRADYSLNCCGAWAAAALGLSGKAREAQTAGRQFLDRIAEKWVLAEKPTDDDIVRWFLGGFPVAMDDVRQKLVQGLEIAGLPAGQNLPPPVPRLTAVS